MNRRDDHRRCRGPPDADSHETVPAVQERDAAADSRPGIRSEVRRSVPMGVQLLQLLGVGLMAEGKRGRAKPWKNRTPDLRCPHCGRAVIVTEYVYYHVSKGGGKVKRF